MSVINLYKYVKCDTDANFYFILHCGKYLRGADEHGPHYPQCEDCTEPLVPCRPPKNWCTLSVTINKMSLLNESCFICLFCVSAFNLFFAVIIGLYWRLSCYMLLTWTNICNSVLYITCVSVFFVWKIKKLPHEISKKSWR